LTPTLINLHNDILAKLEAIQNDRNFNGFLTAIMSDINDLSANRMDARPIVERLFNRLNTNPDGTPIENPFDTRWTSPDFQRYMPIAMSQADLAIFIDIMRNQVTVWLATGSNLDDLGVDYDFPRFQATRAVRRGNTWDLHGNLADFPIGSRFMTRDSGFDPLIFEIFQTSGGEVLFRHIPTEDPFIWGDVANTYFGDLSPASPINGISRATITDANGAYIPGQNRETDEQYRRRFLAFLRRRAFGGNVAQYRQETVEIDGVGDLMIFPVWRGQGTTKISIVDGSNQPVSDEFVEIVNNIIDPMVRSGAGFNHTLLDRTSTSLLGRMVSAMARMPQQGELWMGIAPIGHRVTVETPQWLDINVNITIVLARGIQIGQVQQRLKDIIADYFVELRQSVLDEWDRTYFSTASIDHVDNAWVNLQDKVLAQNEFIASLTDISEEDRQKLMDYTAMSGEWFPAEAAYQTHVWQTVIFPHVIGVRLLETRLISAIDFQNILINGNYDPNGFIREQSQERQYIPRLNNIDIQVVDYIQPQQPPIPMPEMVHKRFVQGFDSPMGEVVSVEGGA